MNSQYIFIAHDLGGGEAINDFIKLKKINPLIISSGPSKELLARYKQIDFSSLNDFVSKYIENKKVEIIVGTGWGDYEINWMEKLSSKKIKFSVIFDNWIFFKERLFKSESKTIIKPNKIYLLNDDAYNHALTLFKVYEIKIINLKISNDYSNLKKIIRKIMPNTLYKIRYISQPLRELSSYSESSKYSRFKMPLLDQHKIFMELVNVLLPKMKCEVCSTIINPHPAEDDLSFQKWNSLLFKLKDKNIDIQNFDKEKVSDNELVFGFNSVALLKASTKSYISFSLCDYVSWKEKLPHKHIYNL